MLQDKPPFCFLHIPKTGGITLRYVIFNNYRNARTYTIDSIIFTDHFLNLPIEEKRKYQLVQGHFTFSEKFAYDERTEFFVMLRDPYKRIISHYNFLYHKKEHPFHQQMIANNYSLKEMLTGGYVRNFDNCLVRFLSGNAAKNFGKINEADLQLALKNFDTYFKHFGIVEHFDETLLLLSYELGWKFPYYTNLNETKTKKINAEVSEETKLLIERNIQYDRLLYGHALNIFQQKIEKNKLRLSNDLKKLKEGNRTKSFWIKLDFLLNRKKVLG